MTELERYLIEEVFAAHINEASTEPEDIASRIRRRESFYVVGAPYWDEEKYPIETRGLTTVQLTELRAGEVVLSPYAIGEAHRCLPPR